MLQHLHLSKTAFVLTQFLPKLFTAMTQSKIGQERTIKCLKCLAPLAKFMPRRGDLKDLPTSFYQNGLINVLACNVWKLRAEIFRKFSSFCFQCGLFYCARCETAHNIMRSNMDHRVMACFKTRTSGMC